jgi:lactoylglutathione lyase
MDALFRRAAGYQGDALRLPVKNVDQALPFYEERLGFHVVERQDEPLKSAILERDGVRIGLVESGGDPTQDGSFFEVSDVDAAFADLKGRGLALAPPSIQRSAHGTYKSFFVVAPDGLCYMVGERVP